jgi:hypothetical protein
MKHYEVWGRDTFAGEDYCCGRFETRAEAEKMLAEQEAEVAGSQPEDLRDTFCIVELGDEGLYNQVEISHNKVDDRAFNEDHLRKCLKELLEKFHSYIDDEYKRWKSTGKYTKSDRMSVSWEDPDDCFTKVGLETYHRGANDLVIMLNVHIRQGKYYDSGDSSESISFSGTDEQFVNWSSTDDAVDDCVTCVKRLMKNFFED